MTDFLLYLWEWLVNLSELTLLYVILKATLQPKNISKAFFYIGIVFLSIATTILNSFQLPNIIAILISLCLYIGYVKLLFNCKLPKACVFSALMVIIMIITNSILSHTVILLPNASAAETLTPSFARFITTAIYIMMNTVFTVCIIAIIKRKKINYPIYVYIGIFSLCVLSIVALYLLVDTAFSMAGAGLVSTTCAIIAIILLVFIIALLILFSLISKETEKAIAFQEENATLRQESQYNTELVKIADSVRQIRHDYANHMNVIATFAKNNELEELKAYMEDYMSEYGQISSFVITDNMTINALLTSKLLICQQESIDVSLSIKDATLIPLNESETASLFGNLLDNAINASRDLPCDKRSIAITVKKRGEMLNINIKNNTNGLSDVIPKDTKNHGLGIPRIKRIVDKYDGICMIKPREGSFEVDILLPVLIKGE